MAALRGHRAGGAPVSPNTLLRLPALEVEQSPGRRLYLFAVEGKLVPSFATVSRVRRDQGELHGYQRPEQLAHIRAIREYMESSAPMVPNAVVLAFDARVRFEPLAEASGPVRHGQLVIPLVDGADAPGFIVDGQQRLAAVREAVVPSFLLACCAFIASTVGEQAEQFILVNSTKPLPKGLIHELLPNTRGALPDALERKRLPAELVARLNQDESSPLRGLIITQTCPAARGKTGKGFTGIFKDTSIMLALESSLTDGALYEVSARGEGVDAMVELLNNFWAAVSSTWPKAWGKQPKDSRLAHGAGVRALGLLMDAAHHFLSREGCQRPTAMDFARELALVAGDCAWTEGTWDFPTGRRRWNELQNTPKEVALLATYLSGLYQGRRTSQPKSKKRGGTP